MRDTLPFGVGGFVGRQFALHGNLLDGQSASFDLEQLGVEVDAPLFHLAFYLGRGLQLVHEVEHALFANAGGDARVDSDVLHHAEVGLHLVREARQVAQLGDQVDLLDFRLGGLPFLLACALFARLGAVEQEWLFQISDG